MLKLPIDHDPQRLKRPRRRIDPTMHPTRYHAMDQIRKLLAAHDRFAAILLDNRPGDPPTQSLLSKLIDRIGNLRIAVLLQPLPSRYSHRHVETQIQWSIKPKRKTTLRVG
jgi:hypothetical protein